MAIMGLNNKYVVVPLWFPIDKNGGGVSDIISIARYDHAELYIMTGAAVTQTATVTVLQGVSVTTCATALNFSLYYQTGFVLKYDGANRSDGSAAGVTVAGAGGGSGLIYEDLGDRVVCYDYNQTTYVDNEVLTFSDGKTAVADGIQINEDIMIPRTTATNNFAITAVTDIHTTYCIPINGAMLVDGNDCIALSITDPLTPSLMVAYAILSNSRFGQTPGTTALYNT